MNSVYDNITFTVEVEQNNTPAFLDTCICLKDDGSTKVKGYQKVTHRDQYFNWESSHSLEQKWSVVKTLLQITESLTPEEEDKTKAVEHIRKGLENKRYKPWIFNTMQPSRKKENVNTRENSRKQHAIGLPYNSKLSEQLARISNSCDIQVYHKPIHSLGLLHRKDKTDKTAKCGCL